jgi:hypothetical protein
MTGCIGFRVTLNTVVKRKLPEVNLCCVASSLLTELSLHSSAASRSIKALTFITGAAHIYIKESCSGVANSFNNELSL